MPYRVHAGALEGSQVPRADASLVRFDASGRAGQPGQPGRNGGDGTGAGADGADGGHAGPAQGGQDAGSVCVTLAATADPGSAQLGGFIVGPDGARRSIGVRLPFGRAGFIDLCARGGDGGAGGVGGRGGDGATGYAGHDATRNSCGTDGGPGGDGGNGGQGTSGGPGGSGGNARVLVGADDTHLLMLLRYDVRGGDGGPPGQNGSGGSGGSGGRGGDSYSWWEEESYTDAQGQRQTRSVHRSNPGGRNGSSGIDGSSGRALLSHGRPGAAGSFQIEVTAPSGSELYASRYDLRLESFELCNENDDGIYEPGERVFVRQLEVSNAGGMPTPASRPIELSLRPGGRIVPEGPPLVLAGPLAAGARHRFETGELAFRISDYRPYGPEDPFECRELVAHCARLPAVEREFSGYETGVSRKLGEIVVQFPVRASAIESLAALAPGEVSRVRFRLTNRSRKPLGSASSSGRVVRARIFARDSELGDAEAALFDASGRRVPLGEGLSFELPELGPGETRDFEVALGVMPDAPAYRSVNLWLALELGPLGDPGRAQPIQYAARSVRVGQRFVAREGTDVLLVVNHRTTRDELAAWQRLCAELSLSLNTWDLSVEGGIDLTAPAGGGAPLLEQLAGGSVIVLNGSVEVGGAETLPVALLAKSQLYDAHRANVNVAVVGALWPLDRVIVPTADERAESATGAAAVASEPLPDIERLVAHMATHDGAAPGSTWCARPASWSLLGRTPTVDVTARRAERLAHELARALPHRRFVVVWQHAPEISGRFLWMKRFALGSLTVRPTIDAAAGRWLSAVATDRELHDPSYILGRANRTTLLLALPFEKKLAQLAVLLARGSHPALGVSPAESSVATVGGAVRGAADAARRAAPEIALLVDALLVDLGNEQLSLLTSRWRSGLSRAGLSRALPLLGRLAAFRRPTPEPLEASSPEGQALVELAARLKFFAQSQTRAWEWLPPLFALRRAPLLRVALGRALTRLIRAFFGPAEDAPDETADLNHDAARRFLRQRLRELRRQYDAARKAGDPACASVAAYARELLLRPIEAPNVTTDAETRANPAERTLSYDEHALIAREDRSSIARVRKLERASDAASATLRHARGCAELIGGGRPA